MTFGPISDSQNKIRSKFITGEAEAQRQERECNSQLLKHQRLPVITCYHSKARTLAWLKGLFSNFDAQSSQGLAGISWSLFIGLAGRVKVSCFSAQT